MNDIIISWIRTAVPAAVGIVLAWLATEFEIVLDEETRTGLVLGVAGLVTAIYHGLVRLVETRVPTVGILLGSKQKPVYHKPVKK